MRLRNGCQQRLQTHAAQSKVSPSLDAVEQKAKPTCLSWVSSSERPSGSFDSTSGGTLVFSALPTNTAIKTRSVRAGRISQGIEFNIAHRCTRSASICAALALSGSFSTSGLLITGIHLRTPADTQGQGPLLSRAPRNEQSGCVRRPLRMWFLSSWFISTFLIGELAAIHNKVSSLAQHVKTTSVLERLSCVSSFVITP